MIDVYNELLSFFLISLATPRAVSLRLHYPFALKLIRIDHHEEHEEHEVGWDLGRSWGNLILGIHSGRTLFSGPDSAPDLSFVFFVPFVVSNPGFDLIFGCGPRACVSALAFFSHARLRTTTPI